MLNISWNAVGRNGRRSFEHVAADAIDVAAGFGRPDDDLRRLAADANVQLRQDDDVELQSLGLVDRHHADVGGRRVFDPLLPTSATKSSARRVARAS